MNTTNASAVIDNMRREFRESKRLRMGFYVIAAILWIYALLVFRDYVARERDAWQVAESRITRAKATAASGDWTTRAQDVKAAAADFERLLWREGSIGLSQAALQESITRNLAAANIPMRSLRVTAAESALSPELGDIVQIRARAQVDFRPTAFYAWLLTLNRDKAEKRPSLAVESMIIRAGQAQAPVADIELVGYSLRNSTTAGNNADSALPPSPSPSPSPSPVSGQGAAK